MKKIGLILYEYPLGVSALLISSAILLAREGYEVHLFVDRNGFEGSRVDFQEDNIIIHKIENLIKVEYNFGIWRKRVLVFYNGKFKKTTISAVYKFVQQFIRIRFKTGQHKLRDMLHRNHFTSLRKKLEYFAGNFHKDFLNFIQKISEYPDDDYVCVIGVEPKGLIAASIFADEKNISVIYYNMELLLKSECKTTWEKALKSLERAYSQKCHFTVIADERRAKYLIADNNLLPEKIVFVPVSSIGKSFRRKSDYLYNKLNIDKNRKILICAGNIIQWSMSLELAQAAQKWSDDFVLVLHSWRVDARRYDYIQQIEKLTMNNKVYLSLDPVEWHQLPELLSSADIGLIFYQNLGPNFYETGLSSNKLAQYLQVGLPVITSDYPSFISIIEGFKCGKCVESPDKIEEQAREIMQDYNTYSSNAIRCYQINYDLSKHFKAVIDKIKTIENDKTQRSYSKEPKGRQAKFEY